MSRGNLIAFDHLTELPTWNNISDATISLNTADDNLGHQFTITAHEEFAILTGALDVTDIQDHKIPFRIHHENFPDQISTQRYVGIVAFEAFQFRFIFGQLTPEHTFFTGNDHDLGIRIFQLFVQFNNLVRGEIRGLISGKRILRVIPFLSSLDEFVRQFIGTFALGFGAGDSLIAFAFGIGKFGLGAGEFSRRLLQFGLGLFMGVLLGNFVFMLGVALRSKLGNLVSCFVITQTTGGESGQNGHN